MSPRLLVIALLTFLLCSCGAEDPSRYSAGEYAPNIGANVTLEAIVVRNAFIIGGRAGEPLKPGSNAPVHATLMSRGAGPDRLVSVSAPTVFQDSRIAGDGLALPVHQVVGGGPYPQALLTGATRQIRSGSYIPVVFDFQHAETVRLQVPILPPSLWRATYSPAPSPS